MILPIYLYGTDVLRAKAEPVLTDGIDAQEIKQFVADLFETMKEADGVGLAAPQVGRSLRVLVVDGRDCVENYPYLKGFVRAMINPEVLEESEETVVFNEGCLSVPDIHCDVSRPAKIKVKYLDENLQEHVEEFDRFAARMVQHELDHLDGVMFVDKVAPIRKKLISSKLHNISRGKVRTDYKSKHN